MILHIVRQVFHPGKLSFPPPYVDADKAYGFELLVHYKTRNRWRWHINSFVHGRVVHTDTMNIEVE